MKEVEDQGEMEGGRGRGVRTESGCMISLYCDHAVLTFECFFDGVACSVLADGSRVLEYTARFLLKETCWRQGHTCAHCVLDVDHVSGMWIVSI